VPGGEGNSMKADLQAAGGSKYSAWKLRFIWSR